MRFYLLIILSVMFISCGTESTPTNSEGNPNDDESVPTYDVITNSSPSEGGDVTISPTGGNYEEGTTIDIEANPADEWEFVEWRYIRY